MSYSSKQVVALALLAVIQLLAAICISLQGSPFPDCEVGPLVGNSSLPLLPLSDASAAKILPVVIPFVFLDGDAAKTQAASAGTCSNGPVYQYDAVFGSFEFTSAFASQLFGIYAGIIGAKFLLSAGMFTAGTCSILNGLMRLTMPPTSLNKGLSMLVKILEAFGTSAVLVAVYTTAIAVYPKHLFLITAILASSHILGSMFGQAFGGLVSLSGAYEISMISVGVLLIVFAIIMLYFLPSLLISLISTKTGEDERRGIFERIHDFNSPLTSVRGYGAVQKSTPDLGAVRYTKGTEELTSGEVSEKTRRVSDTGVFPVRVAFTRSASRRSLGPERKTVKKSGYTSASFADLTSLANQKERTVIKGGFVLPGALTILEPAEKTNIVRSLSVDTGGMSQPEDRLVDEAIIEPPSEQERTLPGTSKEDPKHHMLGGSSVWANFAMPETENFLQETLVGASQPVSPGTFKEKPKHHILNGSSVWPNFAAPKTSMDFLQDTLVGTSQPVSPGTSKEEPKHHILNGSSVWANIAMPTENFLQETLVGTSQPVSPGTSKEEPKHHKLNGSSVWANFAMPETENFLQETLVVSQPASLTEDDENQTTVTSVPNENRPFSNEAPVTSDSQTSFETAEGTMTPGTTGPSSSSDDGRNFQPKPGTSKDDPQEGYQNTEPVGVRGPGNVRSRPVVDGLLQGFSKIWTVLKIPVIWMILGNVFGVAVYHGFFMVLLEPILRPLNLGPVILGSVLLSYGLSFFVSAVIIGFLCHRGLVHPQRLILAGASLTVTSFLLFGPVFITQRLLPLVVSGLVVFGIGMACVMVPSIVSVISATVAAGLPKSVSTYGIVTGMWTATFALGTSIGPSFGRPLLRAIGFQWLIVLLVVSEICLVLISSLCLCFQRHTVPSLPRYTLIHDPASTRVERPAVVTFRR